MRFENVFKASELDRFIEICDELGGWGPKTVERFGDSISLNDKFHVELENPQRDDLDPFSDEYFQNQMSVYAELSCRVFDQATNELLEVDVEQYVANTSPRIADLTFIAHHISTIAAALQVAGLASGANVLDIGCGTGLSSEIMAFSGANVTAVDINPLYIEIVRRRAARLGLPITASNADIFNYSGSEGGDYDAILFFESLHHIPKPWELLQKLSERLKPDGRFIIAGEPISFPSFQNWWRHWGVRRSAEDVYVARKYGWYETGFSEDFLRVMFARAGFAMHTTRLDHSIVGGGRIDIAVRAA